MSADNWSKCPKCKRKQAKSQEKSLENLKKKYGKISPEEYVQMTNKIHNSPERLKETLREDYEIYLEDDILIIVYAASCQECDFYYEYKNELDILAPPKKD